MTLEEIENRLRIIEDSEAIKSLHREYIFLLINHRWEEMIEHFTEDGSIAIATNPPRKGKKNIADLFLNHFAKVIPWDEGHLLAQPVIEINGDKAKGHWLMIVLKKDPMSWTQCRYDCEYAKQNSVWKFSSMKLTSPWPVVPQNKS
jgi:hypothetical protein